MEKIFQDACHIRPHKQLPGSLRHPTDPVSWCLQLHIKKKITLGYGNEFEQTSGDGEGQGSLMYCSPWGCKESEMTEQQQHWVLVNKF